VGSPRKPAQGFSLVELLIGAAAGLLVVSGAIALLVAILRSNNDTIKTTRLNQDLSAIIAIIGNEIRRAGYQGQLETPLADDASLGTQSSCLHYAYAIDPDGADQDSDDVVDEDDELKRHGGFKLSSDGDQVQMYKASSKAFTCSDTGSGSDWEALNDDSEIEITDFQVLEHATCLDSEGDIIGCTDAKALIQVRKLALGISCQLTRDPCVSTTFQQSIRLRNDARVLP